MSSNILFCLTSVYSDRKQSKYSHWRIFWAYFWWTSDKIVIVSVLMSKICCLHFFTTVLNVSTSLSKWPRHDEWCMMTLQDRWKHISVRPVMITASIRPCIVSGTVMIRTSHWGMEDTTCTAEMWSVVILRSRSCPCIVYRLLCYCMISG